MSEFVAMYSGQALYALLTFVFGRLGYALWRKFDKSVETFLERQDRQDSKLQLHDQYFDKHDKAFLTILYDRLFREYDWHMKQGKITLEELRNLEHLYNTYHELGGNGTGTELYERCRHLPIVSDPYDDKEVH